jgi:type IV secretory pathway VirB3-like protein
VQQTAISHRRTKTIRVIRLAGPTLIGTAIVFVYAADVLVRAVVIAVDALTRAIQDDDEDI